MWINQGDIILIGLRDYQDAKADVILKYTPDEARNLKTYGEFPESVRINETVTFVEEGFDEDIEFGDDISSAEEGDPVDAIWCRRIGPCQNYARQKQQQQQSNTTLSYDVTKYMQCLLHSYTYSYYLQLLFS